MLDERVVLLEEKYLYQEKLIEELNDMIVNMNVQIQKQSTQIMLLHKKLMDIDDKALDEVKNEVPPHY